MNIGIIGYGFVGEAVNAGFEKNIKFIVDPKIKTTTQDLLKEKIDVVFVCVPTPMSEDGSIDSSIVESVFTDLKDYNGLVVLKSTVLPYIAKSLSTKVKNFVYNPEFLTEANAIRDFLNPEFHVFGGEQHNVEKLEYVYSTYSVCAHCAIWKTTIEEAAAIKYGINSYLFMKVLFWNQYKDFCEEQGINYEVVKDAIRFGDPRIGSTHMNVPGPDGRKGSASACFAKDIPALLHFDQNNLSILREAWNRNCDIRNSYGKPLPRELNQHITFRKI